MTTKTETTTWVRYRHKQRFLDVAHGIEKPLIEYDVEAIVQWPDDFDGHDSSLSTAPTKFLKCYDGYFKIRTVRNLFYREEIHIPGFTYMPADKFLSLYERAG